MMNEKVSKWLFICLTATILIQNVSVALGNIFLGLALVFSSYLLYKNKTNLGIDPIYIPYIKAAFIFFLCTLPSALFVADLKIGLKSFMELWIYRTLPLFMLLLFIKDNSLIKRSLPFIVGICCLLNFFALINFIIPPPHTLLMRTNFLHESYRTSLPFACIMCEVISIPLIIIYDGQFTKKTKSIATFSLIFAIIGIISGQSRGSWLTVCTIILILSLIHI